MDISIIIVNYNTCNITRKCLDSIFKWTHDVTFEVIVVDNDSYDGSKDMLSSYQGIKYVQSGRNLGFGKANNLGYKVSTGRYVLLLNSDTFLLNNAIKHFVDEFEKLEENVGCIGCRLQAPDGSANHSFGLIPNLTMALKGAIGIYLRPFGVSFKRFNEHDFDGIDKLEVEYVIGADLCIRREVVEKCGLFDPDFFMYYEESEMQSRYQKAGYKSMIVSTPKIVHLECVSTKKKGKKYTYHNRSMFFGSYILYMKKKYGWFKYILFRFLFLFYIPIFFASYYSFIESLKMVCMAFSPVKTDKHE